MGLGLGELGEDYQRSRYYYSVSHRPWLFLLNDLYGIKNILFMLIMFLYIN